MDLRSNNPFWLMKDGLLNTYPSLSKNISSEVAIIGAGITGALIAYHLCKQGIKVVVIDRRHVGMGSTAASTSLLQYEIDTPLRTLIKKVGEKNAVRSYELCLHAIEAIKKINNSLKDDLEFESKESLQFASFKKHVKHLEEEYLLRQKHQVAHITWLDSKEIKQKFGFEKPAALLSKEGAVINAYKFTHLLLAECVKMGGRIFDNTTVAGINHKANKVELLCKSGERITAKKLVIACGYESQQYIDKTVEIPNSTYAIISEPLATLKNWYKDCMIWETADPYIYLRSTKDNRILIGGKDDGFYNPEKRDSVLPVKVKQLEKSFNDLFPHIPFKTDFYWAGFFSKTKDGLPFIGSISQRPNTYFALGFGGNGITFSLLAAEMITDIYTGNKNEDINIFSFNR